ncbi:hypothetical protein L2E82_06458 [Cichorium intybus]|uniref:Uncharacterized protein n=1 Tax=Cichorium intybus TaxID=13427 RepID=A0ACB9HBL4_CICIN|nr:hypothetical protein L2E82_06458 [Cichorium intybus]
MQKYLTDEEYSAMDEDIFRLKTTSLQRSKIAVQVGQKGLVLYDILPCCWHREHGSKDYSHEQQSSGFREDGGRSRWRTLVVVGGSGFSGDIAERFHALCLKDSGVLYEDPYVQVRENAILLNLGPLRAIAMQESVFIFNYNRRAGKAFIDSLLPRLNPKSAHGGPVIPFELEVVEAALHSRIQCFEDRLMEFDPRVSMET